MSNNEPITTPLACFAYLHLSNVTTVGHGRSGGERVMIDTFDTFVDDIFAHLDEVKKVYPDIPVYLFGHSMVGEGKEVTPELFLLTINYLEILKHYYT